MEKIVRKVWGRVQRIARENTVRFRSPVRVAIVGCGGIAPAHLTGYQLSGRALIVGASDLRAEALAEMAAQAPGVRTFRDYRQLLEEVRPEVISICTWPR